MRGGEAREEKDVLYCKKFQQKLQWFGEKWCDNFVDNKICVARICRVASATEPFMGELV